MTVNRLITSSAAESAAGALLFDHGLLFFGSGVVQTLDVDCWSPSLNSIRRGWAAPDGDCGASVASVASVDGDCRVAEHGDAAADDNSWVSEDVCEFWHSLLEVLTPLWWMKRKSQLELSNPGSSGATSLLPLPKAPTLSFKYLWRTNYRQR